MSRPEMIERWTLEYDSDVIHYLYFLRESGAELRKAIRSLVQGIPTDARKLQEEPETWEWLEARHWITLVVERKRHWIGSMFRWWNRQLWRE